MAKNTPKSSGFPDKMDAKGPDLNEGSRKQLPSPGLNVSRAEIARAYAYKGKLLSGATISRLNKCGRRPDVNCPPPWHDPAKLRRWYRLHYMGSSTPGAALRRRETLPKWLERATGRRDGGTGGAESSADQSPKTGAMTTEEIVEHYSGASIREMEHYRTLASDDPERAAVLLQAAKMVADLQLAEKRARECGETLRLWRATAAEALDGVSAAMQQALIHALTGAREEAATMLRPTGGWENFVNGCVYDTLQAAMETGLATDVAGEPTPPPDSSEILKDLRAAVASEKRAFDAMAATEGRYAAVQAQVSKLLGDLQRAEMRDAEKTAAEDAWIRLSDGVFNSMMSGLPVRMIRAMTSPALREVRAAAASPETWAEFVSAAVAGVMGQYSGARFLELVQAA